MAKPATMTRMPTPVGHALGGLATAWFGDSIAAKRRSNTLAVACAMVAVAPDIDILFRRHRMYTHSIGAMIAVGVIAWFVARWRRAAPTRTALIIAAAYGSHILLDWLAMDTAEPAGLTALWPFSSRFYLSCADLFMEVSRRYWKPDEFIFGNLKAVGWEVLLLGPIAVAAWWLRRRSRTADGREMHGNQSG
jgi:hypothetical protein